MVRDGRDARRFVRPYQEEEEDRGALVLPARVIHRDSSHKRRVDREDAHEVDRRMQNGRIKTDRYKKCFCTGKEIPGGNTKTKIAFQVRDPRGGGGRRRRDARGGLLRRDRCVCGTISSFTYCIQFQIKYQSLTTLMATATPSAGRSASWTTTASPRAAPPPRGRTCAGESTSARRTGTLGRSGPRAGCCSRGRGAGVQSQGKLSLLVCVFSGSAFNFDRKKVKVKVLFIVL